MPIRIRHGQPSLFTNIYSEGASQVGDQHRHESSSNSAKSRCSLLKVVTGIVSLLICILFLSSLFYSTAVGDGKDVQRHDIIESSVVDRKCAVLFWGLPRSFRSLVLPSITKNIIMPNAKYGCDYFVHFYFVTNEAAGRSGTGGSIDPEAIYSLKDAVFNQRKETSLINGNEPIVEFTYTKEEDFWSQYNPLIEKIRSTKDGNGNYLYFPWKAKTYSHPTTTDNIVKMWHSIQSVWNLMESKGTNYKQIAMCRSDVVYLNPIDIFDIPSTESESIRSINGPNDFDEQNNVVIPNFGNHPVSDRLIYGGYNAVKVWATERFNMLDRHVSWISENDPGWGLHSERFMNYTIFPLIRNSSVLSKYTKIIPHPTLW